MKSTPYSFRQKNYKRSNPITKTNTKKTPWTMLSLTWHPRLCKRRPANQEVRMLKGEVMLFAAPRMRITKCKPTRFWTSFTVFHHEILHLQVCLRGVRASDYDKARQDEDGRNASDCRSISEHHLEPSPSRILSVNTISGTGKTFEALAPDTNCRHYCRRLTKSRNERSLHVTWQDNGGYISETSEEDDDSWGRPKRSYAPTIVARNRRRLDCPELATAELLVSMSIFGQEQ
jgi:hypothetical protein